VESTHVRNYSRKGRAIRTLQLDDVLVHRAVGLEAEDGSLALLRDSIHPSDRLANQSNQIGTNKLAREGG
jgi:hypothetical protein